MLFMPPMLLIALSTLGLFFFRNKVTKFCFLGIGLAFCTVLFLEFCVLGNFERCVKYEDQKLVEHYSQTQAEFEPLPDLSELGTTTHLEFYDYFLQEGLFQAQANALFCHYDAAEYQAQKMRLDEQYLFRTQKFDGNGSPTAEIKGYRFRVVDAQDSNYKLEDCARMILIATNDQTQEIVYLTIDDEYTYEISSFTDFINEDCGWEHMR